VAPDAKSGALLIVDAPSLLFRAFHALPTSITDDNDRPVNALLGTANMLLQEIETHEPRATVLCFGPDAAEYRTELYEGYHAERPPLPDELAPQFAACEDFFGAFGFTVTNHDTLEADDLLGSYATREAASGGHALVLTGDRDMYQCAAERVTVLYVKTGARGADVVDPKEVRKRYGVDPGQVPDFIALRGDPSDGLPGAKGIGEKTAAELLQRHVTLEATLKSAVKESKPSVRSALMADPDLLLAFKEIATLRDTEVDLPSDSPLDREAAAEKATEYGMNRLAQRLKPE